MVKREVSAQLCWKKFGFSKVDKIGFFKSGFVKSDLQNPDVEFSITNPDFGFSFFLFILIF